MLSRAPLRRCPRRSPSVGLPEIAELTGGTYREINGPADLEELPAAKQGGSSSGGAGGRVEVEPPRREAGSGSDSDSGEGTSDGESEGESEGGDSNNSSPDDDGY